MSDWVVKYDGPCSRCGTLLVKGKVAVWDRATRTMRCVACPSVINAAVSEPTIDQGIAGASARREYERRHAKRDTDTRARWGDRLGGLVLAVTSEPQAARAWAIGAAGEEKLARALEGIESLQVLHDRRVPGTKGNIDHILVAPAGVFVVDAKHYEGRIEIRNRGWFLRPDYRLYVGGRDRSALAGGLGWQVEALVQVLRAAGVDSLLPITPVLCFVDGNWPLIGRPTSYEGVRLEGVTSLRKLLTRPEDLDPAEIGRLTRILAVGLPAK